MQLKTLMSVNRSCWLAAQNTGKLGFGFQTRPDQLHFRQI